MVFSLSSATIKVSITAHASEQNKVMINSGLERIEVTESEKDVLLKTQVP